MFNNVCSVSIQRHPIPNDFPVVETYLSYQRWRRKVTKYWCPVTYELYLCLKQVPFKFCSNKKNISMRIVIGLLKQRIWKKCLIMSILLRPYLTSPIIGRESVEMFVYVRPCWVISDITKAMTIFFSTWENKKLYS